MKEKIPIALIEDNRHTQEAVGSLISQTNDLELLWRFDSAEDALSEFNGGHHESTPEVILTRIHLPGISGINATPYLTRLLPNSRVIILSRSDQKEELLSAVTNGIHGYILKTSSPRNLLSAIRNVAAGKVEIDPSVAAHLFDALGRSKTTSSDFHSDVLSKREMQVLEFIAEGMSRKGIATSLSISENTVVFHTSNIYEKLEVRNAPSAVAMAYKLGIFSNDSAGTVAPT
jgi:DNA-binding NarL/FixJ family response regulator